MAGKHKLPQPPLSLGIKHLQAVAPAATGEVAIGHGRLEQVVLAAALQPMLQRGFRGGAQQGLMICPGLVFTAAQLPLAHEQGLAIQVGRHLVQGDVMAVQQAGPEKRWLHPRFFWNGHRALCGFRRGIRRGVPSGRGTAGWRCVPGWGGWGLFMDQAHPWRDVIQKSLPVIPAVRLTGLQIGIHEAQVGEGIPAVDHLALVHRTAIPVDKPGGEGCTPQDDRHLDAGIIECRQVVFHEGC